MKVGSRAARKAEKPDGPDPIDIHVGARLRLRRNLSGMSQEQLGKALGLTFQQIQKYERGTNRMGASRLYQLADTLAIPIQWFFEELQSGAPVRGFSENKQAELDGAPRSDAELDHEILHRRETLELV